MSEDTQKSNRPTIESMVYKMFRYQQRQKYWQIAKFSFLVLVSLSIGFTVLKQANQSFGYFLKGKPSHKKFLDQPHISLVELKGVISGSFEATKPSTVDSLVPALRRAFKMPKTVAVVLRINSPGGSPVQSHEIYSEIINLREKYPNIPIYAVFEEICASGAYYIASACSAIYANPHTQVGSLGVVISDFGYDELLKKLGIERRLITSGTRKGMLDPYSPLKKEDLEITKEMMLKTHQIFIDAVKHGRGDRLKDLSNNEEELFSGRVWMGTQALELGLIDGFGNLDRIAQEYKVGIVNCTPQPDWIAQLRKITGITLSSILSERLLISQLTGPVLSKE